MDVTDQAAISRPAGPRSRVVPLIAATVIALVLAAGFLGLRSAAPTYPVGDVALLEVYTLHAAHGVLDVGAYSRFGWHHPGPALFYLFAPGYALSGYHETSLLLATLLLNLVAVGACLFIAARHHEPVFAYALAGWIALLYARGGNVSGWDFGDLLSLPWNPLAPILLFALLMLLAAALGAGHATALPWLALAGSVVVQAHVAFIPAALAAIAAGGILFALSRTAPSFTREWSQKAAEPGRVWVRFLDTVGALYFCLFLLDSGVGGIRVEVAGVIVNLRAPDRLLWTACALVAVRGALSRERSWLARPVGVLLDRFEGLRGAAVAAPRVRRSAGWTAGVLFLLWLPPLVEAVARPGPANLIEIAQSIGEGGRPDISRGTAAFSHAISTVVRPDAGVAAGGRVLTVADLSVLLALGAVLQIVGLAVAVSWAFARGRLFMLSLAVTCIAVSFGAWWSMTRVRGALHDHLAFWIAIVGIMNLAVITTMVCDQVPARAKRLLRRALRSRTLIVMGCVVASLGAYGLSHVAAGHQQSRFPAERATVEDLWRSLPVALEPYDLDGRAVLVDMDQDAWGVASGLVLQLYRAGIAVRVPQEWVFLFGDALAPAGDEYLELMVAHERGPADPRSDPAYHLVARRGQVLLYLRELPAVGR